MNIKDIALMKFKDIEDDKIIFYRAKTRLTSKGNQKPITVYLNKYAKKIIRRYGNKNQDGYVFDILKKGLSDEQQRAEIHKFTRFVNQHIKTLCKANKLPDQISTYWARHSFATNAVRNGATMEFIQESLGHGNLKTTQSYFAGFDNETRKEFADSLMNF